MGGVRLAGRCLAGRCKVGGAGLRIAGVLTLAVVEGRAVGRVNPGDPGEVADAGVAGEGFAAPQGDQRRVGDELAVRAVRCAGVDLFGAGAEGLVVRPADPVHGRVCCWPEQPTTTVLPPWVSASDAGTVVPIRAGAQPARKPRASRMAVKAAACRLGEGFMVPPRDAHHNVRRGGGGDGWEDAAGAAMVGEDAARIAEGSGGCARWAERGEGCTVRL